jgi:hypothetical protein
MRLPDFVLERFARRRGGWTLPVPGLGAFGQSWVSPHPARLDIFSSKDQDGSRLSDYNPNRNPYIQQFVQHCVQRTGG